jgi:AraC-like DNA-binding protein
VDELIRSRSLSERDPLPIPGNLQQLSVHFARAISTLESDDVMASEMRRALATLILAELNLAPASERFLTPSLVDKAVQLLHETSTRGMSLEQIAEHLNVGYHTLRQRFKSETGYTMHQLREELRLKHAALLLRNQELAVKEVALECGFADPYYFSRAFRRRFGVSPLKYRK